jgi:hypothetical protein
VPQAQCQARYALPPLWESTDGVFAIAVFPFALCPFTDPYAAARPSECR